MRIAKLVFAGSLAAIAAIGAPVLAKSSEHQKADEKTTTSVGCQAYQQAADGSWTQLPAARPVRAAQPSIVQGPKARTRTNTDRNAAQAGEPAADRIRLSAYP